ncbi:MAG: bifunctional histidinol-phosphatase/imidazoleglycerol-phosphate dehydratase HisB [Candidatus Saccharimonadaceae bacterium]
MKKVLFIDRDGTLIIEPAITEQIDSLELLEFYPHAFQYMARIANELDYELVLVSNQDGLGTDSFPEDTFYPAHQKFIQAFANEGVVFAEELIDRSFPQDNSLYRKPNTGMLTHYIKGDYDLKNSFVIGDRNTDVQLAKNLGCKAIYLNKEKHPDAALCTTEWSKVYAFLKKEPRTATIVRKTAETDINITVNLDGTGKSDISTGLHFFDHMLEQIARHGKLDLKIAVIGDLLVDAHHTVEDVALVLGEAILQSLGSKKGIERYGFLLPMDDCLAQVAIDFGGRPWLVWEVDFKYEKIGDVPTEMFYHFFKSFSDTAKCNLNIKADGDNQHHKIEAIFKAFAKAIKNAVKIGDDFSIPSTKGIL